MSKPWQERPLWWRVYLGALRTVYMNTGHLIGHLGTTPFAFFDAAKELPDYDLRHYEKAVRDLTVWSFTQASPPRYELTTVAKKVLRTVIGPAPDDPEYVAWWRARLISVEQMRAAGVPVLQTDTPPVPLPEGSASTAEEAASRPEEPAAAKPKKKRGKKQG